MSNMENMEVGFIICQENNKTHFHLLVNPLFSFSLASKIPTSIAHFLTLFLAHLKDIKLQIIGIPRSPQYRVIRRLGPEFHLAQALMDVSCRLADGLGKQLIIHEMGAGTGCQKSPVFYQLHGTQIDLPVSPDCIFNRVPGLGKGRRIQDHHVNFSPFFSSSGRSSKTSHR